MYNPTQPPAPVVIVGGGLAGLSAGLRLAERGTQVTVLEGESEVGGRARSLTVGGEPLDRGFQSLFSAYPATGRFLRDIGMTSGDVASFGRGAVVHDGARWSRLSVSAGGVLGFPWLHRRDLLRLARLGAEVTAAPVESLLWGAESAEETGDYLRRLGFGQEAMDGFFRPLFGVITADRELRSDAGYFRFLLKMLLRGRAVVPVEGHGMIARWAAARIGQLGGTVLTDAAVSQVVTDRGDRGRATGVLMGDGSFCPAHAVVVATDAPAARRLLQDLDRQAARSLDLQPRGVTTLAFSLRRSFHSGRTVVLNAAPDGGSRRIDLVCQESNVLRPGMGTGARLLATCVHGDDGIPDAHELERAMSALAGVWNPGYPWDELATLEQVIVHPWAQFAVTPGVRSDLPDAATDVVNVFLAGDYTAHPSVEGAVGSGERAADVVQAWCMRHSSVGA